MSDDIFIFDESGTILKGVKDTTIKSVIIPNGVKSIGKKAFYEYSGLKSVVIPSNVTSIGDHTFYKCTGLTSVTIGNGVTRIGDWAFEHCRGLTSITIPNSVTSIGRGAFRGCSSLTSIEIPNSVTSIEGDAFNETAWYDNQPDGVVYAGNVAYKYKGTIPENTKVTLLEGTKCIAKDAFSDCTGLTSIEIPSSVNSIGHKAFYGCTGLISIEIPNSVTNIGTSAFSECYSLYSVNLGINVKNIGKSAFYECRRLKKIIIPKTVEHIGESAFDGCPIEKVTLPKETKYNTNSFDKMTKIINLKVFISYSWDDEEHKAWVKKLATDLNKYVYVILDQWDLRAGNDMAHFMEQSVSQSNKVLCILTPNYKQRCDNRKGGSGFESSLISAEILNKNPPSKFIPILRSGDFNNSKPTALSPKLGLDFSSNDPETYKKNLEKLLSEIKEENLRPD